MKTRKYPAKHPCHNTSCVHDSSFLVWRKVDGTDQLKTCGSHIAIAVRKTLDSVPGGTAHIKNLV